MANTIDEQTIGQLATEIKVPIPESRFVTEEATGVMYNSKREAVGLSLHGCGIENVPAAILELGALKILYLVDNRIKSIPDGIDQLASLQKLDLWRNQLACLPESIGNLAQLKKLYLTGNERAPGEEAVSGNSLTALPESIGNLQSLELLNVSSNKLASLPASIGSSPS